jgi:hypothetical protein
MNEDRRANSPPGSPPIKQSSILRPARSTRKGSPAPVAPGSRVDEPGQTLWPDQQSGVARRTRRPHTPSESGDSVRDAANYAATGHETPTGAAGWLAFVDRRWAYAEGSDRQAHNALLVATAFALNAAFLMLALALSGALFVGVVLLAQQMTGISAWPVLGTLLALAGIGRGTGRRSGQRQLRSR